MLVKVKLRKVLLSALTTWLLSRLTCTLSFFSRNRVILYITRSPDRFDFTRTMMSSAYRQNRCPRFSSPLSRSSRRMLLRSSDNGPPCGTPLVVWFRRPFTTTPARRYLPISLRMPLSVRRRLTRSANGNHSKCFTAFVAGTVNTYNYTLNGTTLALTQQNKSLTFTCSSIGARKKTAHLFLLRPIMAIILLDTINALRYY